MIIQYAVHNINDLDNKHDRYDFEVAFFDAEFPYFVAAECAEHYYDNHDGWDADLNGEIFRLFINDEVIGDFEIYIENRPYFSAVKIKKQELIKHKKSNNKSIPSRLNIKTEDDVKYDLILAEPPWQYHNTTSNGTANKS